MHQSTLSLVSPVQGRWLLDPMLELANLLREQTAWTWQHSGRVGRYAVAFGKQLGLDAQSLMALQCAALLHDVGKIAVPPEVLDKTSSLTRDEWFTITKHSMASSLMLKSQHLPRQAIAIAQSHHEWYNGKGYPLGLEGDSIPLGARILSMADAYDAMNSDRPYRPALRPGDMANEFERGAGTQFDPVLVRALMPLILSGPDTAILHKRLRVISDDQELFRELWFAAYPLGWELEVWPPTWASTCPQELRAPQSALGQHIHLTLIDGRSARRVPEGILDNLQEPCLWLDPIMPRDKAAFRPLDLSDLWDYLDTDPRVLPGVASKSRPVRVLLADPFQLFRQVLRRCLDERPEVQVVAEVRSPAEYRLALSTTEVDLAIVASDLLEGTRSTAPLRPDDLRLADHETSTPANRRPTIVLVADEDLDIAGMAGEVGAASSKIFIPRSAPVEVLLQAMNRLIGTEFALTTGDGLG